MSKDNLEKHEIMARTEFVVVNGDHNDRDYYKHWIECSCGFQEEFDGSTAEKNLTILNHKIDTINEKLGLKFSS